MPGLNGPSMKDVAARAGVSIGTVSNVLNRPQVVSDRSRRKVLSAIEALGFVRNESARQLRGGASRTIAFVMFDVSNPFFADVAQGAQAAAEEAGRALYLCDSREDSTRQNAYLDLLEQQRVEGVLITPIDPLDPRLEAFAARGNPVVAVARGHGTGRCSVSGDYVAGGELAATHLLDLGHRHIAFAGRSDDLGGVTERLIGVRRAVARAGAELTVLETTGFTLGDGRRAAERLIGIPSARRPSGVVSANDLVALGLLQHVIRLGLRVPQDVAIVGYDDIEFAESASVPLTSVAQPRRLIGRTAIELLLAQARDEVPDNPHVLFSPELVVRASTWQRPIERTG